MNVLIRSVALCIVLIANFLALLSHNPIAAAQSPTPTPTATTVPPTATALPPTVTTAPPTATALPPTATTLPPTATALPPTATTAPPTATTLPPTATTAPPTPTTVSPTATTLPPTATTLPPTATTLPPTATALPPTATTLPPTATPQPTAATTLTDDLNDYTKLYERSNASRFYIQTGDATLTAGDPSRLVRYVNTTEWVTWQLTNVRSVTATAYFWPNETITHFSFAYASNNTSFTAITPIITDKGGNWRQFVYTLNLPAGATYVRVIFPTSTNNWTPQLGQVVLSMIGATALTTSTPTPANTVTAQPPTATTQPSTATTQPPTATTRPFGISRVFLTIVLANSMFGPVDRATPTPSPTPASTPAATPFPEATGVATGTDADWPQLGHDPQRTNASKVQVDAPYCYAWKWYEAPFTSRIQPVVGNGILYLGSLNSKMYARDARTGAPKWEFTADGPIRHSAGVLVGSVFGGNGIVVFSTYNGLEGSTYGLDALSGAQLWKKDTGPSTIAPLLDPVRFWAYVGSTNGKFTALDLKTGEQKWQKDLGAPLLTSPSLSNDGKTVFLGSEDIKAIGLDAATGDVKWQTKLQGQSLADRYPVVINNTVIYRSQPSYFFHFMLQQWGDGVMDQAGPVNANAEADWNLVRPKIVNHLTTYPEQQTFFTLNAADGTSRGVAPVLYAYGRNDPGNMPVFSNGKVYLTYRARHGIQTDSGTVHVTTKYDAELGSMDMNTLDITGLKGTKMNGDPNWRMTSDEPAFLTMAGNTIWVDNWERVGVMDLRTGVHTHATAIGNPAPGCNEYCGGSVRPFFPLTGTGLSYPYPAKLWGEGEARGGAVIANGIVYWHLLGGGIAAIKTQQGGSCSTPGIYGPSPEQGVTLPPVVNTTRTLTDYVSLDLTTPVNVSSAPADLVARLRDEVRVIVTSGGHLTPFYLERGFSQTQVWPAGSPKTKSDIPSISFEGHGNLYWFDPSELLYTVAMAYPYLDAGLQQQAKAYMADEMKRYPPLERLPYAVPKANWLGDGVARERYNVPMRSKLNNWPVAKVSLSALYGVWLWAKNTGDWSYACANSAQIKAIYEELKGNVRYYADIGGLIGYARLSQALSQRSCAGWASTDYASAQATAVNALQTGQNFAQFQTRAQTDFLDPFDQPTGWSMPAFFGLTPELGAYVNEQTKGAARNEIAYKQGPEGMRWWWFTHIGLHAEVGETSMMGPHSAWSHFLARAYITKDSQATLRKFLDYAWGKGDLYSIQKLVATIQAP